MSDTEVCLSSSKDEEEEDALEFCERGAEIISGKESEVHVFANDFYFLYLTCQCFYHLLQPKWYLHLLVIPLICVCLLEFF